MQNELIENIKSLSQSGKHRDEILDIIVETLDNEYEYYDWVGFYIIVDGKLVLGPYRGKSSPHEVIEFNEGICGAAARTKSTIIVNDVNSDPRYLACSVETKSEIVVPILSNGDIVAQIEFDSSTPAAFTEKDKVILEQIAGIISVLF
ncbi:MAG: GAF domain-containing protein [candidate division Zixibacteria bacterium]|nr:GAF domain-containing protein [candidate division Zixibacteria bacterium]